MEIGAARAAFIHNFMIDTPAVTSCFGVVADPVFSREG
jgi:hypothetical protein